MGKSIGRSVGRSVGRLVGRSVGRSVGRLGTVHCFYQNDLLTSNMIPTVPAKMGFFTSDIALPTRTRLW